MLKGDDPDQDVLENVTVSLRGFVGSLGGDKTVFLVANLLAGWVGLRVVHNCTGGEDVVQMLDCCWPPQEATLTELGVVWPPQEATLSGEEVVEGHLSPI